MIMVVYHLRRAYVSYKLAQSRKLKIRSRVVKMVLHNFGWLIMKTWMVNDGTHLKRVYYRAYVVVGYEPNNNSVKFIV